MTFGTVSSNIFVQSANQVTSPINNEVTSPISTKVTSPVEEQNYKSVTYPDIIGYYPSLTRTVEEKRFNNAFDNATKLSDGSALLRPTMLGSSSTIIENDDGTYTIKTQPSKMGAEPTFKTITEEELIADKNLCAGLLYKNEDGTYDITYEFKDNDTNEWIPVTFTGTEKQTIINTMKQENMHF